MWDLGDPGPNAISLSEVVVGRGGIGELETAEKSWVMMGWDGSAVLRLRLRDGGGWRRLLRAAGLGAGRDVVGDWAAVGGGMDPGGLGCSIHPSARLSRCVPGELGSWGQGLRLGHHQRWCRDCIHEGERAVGVTAVGSPGWSGPDHIGSRHSMVGWR